VATLRRTGHMLVIGLRLVEVLRTANYAAMWITPGIQRFGDEGHESSVGLVDEGYGESEPAQVRPSSSPHVCRSYLSSFLNCRSDIEIIGVIRAPAPVPFAGSATYRDQSDLRASGVLFDLTLIQLTPEQSHNSQTQTSSHPATTTAH
jgi:hypothetical protein